MTLALRIALRELRGGLKDFRLFLGCLIVGVTVIAAVGVLSVRVENGIRHEAKTLLGGDVEIGIANARATPEQEAFLHTQGKVSLTLGMRAMAGVGDESTLVELKGVDENYPLLGSFTLASHQPLSRAIGDARIVIGEDLRERFALKIGDRLTLGDAPFTVSGIIADEPDHIAGAFSLGPRVIASMADMEKAGLLQPGSLVHYNYRLLLQKPALLGGFKEELSKRFPHAPWIIKTANESNRTVQGLVERLQLFLTLAGLSSLLIGGVGIRGATESYIGRKSATVATFKSLGATRDTVFAIYMIVLLLITVIGIAASMILGLLLSATLLPYFAQFFPVSLDSSADAPPLLLAATFGALTVFTFSIAALARGVEVKPTLLFRGLNAAANISLPRSRQVATILLVAALILLTMVTSEDKKIAGGFIIAAVFCFGVFLLVARLVEYAARHMHLPSGRLRMAVANLHRPGAPVFSIMLSIGIAASVLVALLLVEANIERDIGESIPARAPTMFLIDIQPFQKDVLAAFLASKPYVSEIVNEPMVRGRIAKLNGVPVERAAIGDDAKWATESDRGFSYAATPPTGTRIAEGTWWPVGYHGAPLVSLDSKLAQGMGLKVGDKITLNILGQDIDATIASLREVNYMSLRMNFALIFSPGAIEHFPATGLATLRIAGENNEQAFMREFTHKFSNIPVIRVRESLAQFQEIVGHIAVAVRVTAAFALVSGLMVLSSALAASLDKRMLDTVIFKVIGARRRDILSIFLGEWSIIAIITGLLSCVFGTAGAWLILKRMQWMEFHFFPATILEVIALIVAFILLTGIVLHFRAFALKAGTILRNG